ALTQGRTAEALTYYRRSLEHSQPGDSLVPKSYALLTRGHRQAGQADEALAVCRAGRGLCPRHPELAFWEGVLLRERQDRGGAEACFLEVLHTPDGEPFTSVDAGLRSYRTRHALAEVYRLQGRLAEAEAQWRAAAAECPAFTPAWQGVAELLLEQRRWTE